MAEAIKRPLPVESISAPATRMRLPRLAGIRVCLIYAKVFKNFASPWPFEPAWNPQVPSRCPRTGASTPVLHTMIAGRL
ncbi:hypothetical protein GCM10010341_58420 [Streptomyces noursei]|nr:hypothetical protein GCM10010341_58420 [Streptomyces noursei]